MKILKFIFLLLTVLAISSCGKDKAEPVEKPEEPAEKITKETVTVDATPALFYGHELYLSILDLSGNDLTKGIGFDSLNHNSINSELYTFDYLLEEGIPNPAHPVIPVDKYGIPEYQLHEQGPLLMCLYSGQLLMDTHKGVSLNVNPDYNYVWLAASSYKPEIYYGAEIKFAEKIIFRITSPYIFGDNQAHDVVTWWKLNQNVSKKEGVLNHTVCYRVEFEGKELPLVTHDVYGNDEDIVGGDVLHDIIPFATITLNR